MLNRAPSVQSDGGGHTLALLQMVTAAAVPMVTHGAKGRTVVAARQAGGSSGGGGLSAASSVAAIQPPQTTLFPGGSAVLGDEAHDEELHVDGSL